MTPVFPKGLRVFPCKIGTKEPAIYGWASEATDNRLQIEAWAKQFPNCNWAVATGASGLAVIDIDGEAGEQSLFAFELDHGALPPTREQNTPHGRHLIFSGAIKPTVGALGSHLDTRGGNSYIIVAPSIVDGIPYLLNDAPLASLPAFVSEAAGPQHERKLAAPGTILDTQANRARAKAYLNGLVEAGDVAIEGSGGDARTFALAAEIMDRFALSPDGALEVMQDWNAACQPSWDYDQLQVKVDKSEAGAFEMACHLTGQYPSWWTGRRWDRPINAWTGGESSAAVRQIQQQKLLGPAGVVDAQGTGFIPRTSIVKISASHGIADAVDTVQVKHASGGVSTLGFKSYEQGRGKWQGATLDLVWLDEEPEMPIYSEALTRVAATGGMIYTTFTPLLGISEVVGRFIHERSANRAIVGMTIDDAAHIPASERESIIAGYLPHEREARAKGIPMLGSGRVFLTPEAEIATDPFEIPEYFALLWAIDPGVGHPFAAILLAWDRETDVVYVVHTVRMADAMVLDHAEAMKGYDRKWGEKIPVAWPQDTSQRREFEGALEPLVKIYKTHGLKMLSTHATFPDGSNSTEAGIALMAERFRTKKLRVFKTCPDFFEEYRIYHRKEGRLVKLKDDIMSATRVGLMTLRLAQPVKWHAIQAAQNRERGNIALNAELSGDDLF